MKIKFIGASREVTGSKFLLTTGSGKTMLLDCGMFQGKGLETDAANRNLGFDPAALDHIILTHGHIDHSGLIPFMYKNGFRGSVICTHATRAICAVMLPDCGFIQEHDTVWFNKKRTRQGLSRVEPIYRKVDADACMKLFISVPYGLRFQIDSNIKVRFTNTGHMIGSAVANLEINENGKTIRIAYTGDIGRSKSRVLHEPEPFPQCDYLITESTYGDRLHPVNEEADSELLRIVKETCVKKGGKLIIPSFAIGRTQEVVFALNNYFNEGKLPRINIFVDSPLAVNATDIYRLHMDSLNEEVREVLETDPDPFGFSSLHYIKSAEESKKLNFMKKPCVIISASGMMEAGRVKHHLANNISNPQNTILAVGYCSPETLGARILRGDKEVSIFGEKHIVKADVERIEAFSGHGDYNEMIGFISCQDKSQIRNVFLVHGEYEAQQYYKKQLENAGFRNLIIPGPGNEFELN